MFALLDSLLCFVLLLLAFRHLLLPIGLIIRLQLSTTSLMVRGGKVLSMHSLATQRTTTM